MPSPTDASLPERLADAEGELPTRLRIIADGDLRTMARDSLVGIHPDQHELHEWADLMDEAADALTAAESAREAAVAERDEARANLDKLEDTMAPLSDDGKCVWIDGSGAVPLDFSQGRDLAAALARAERAEKAIRDFLSGDYPNPRDHRPGKCKHGVFYWEDCCSCADEHFAAALAHPAAAEET